MRTLSTEMIRVFALFAPLFSKPVFQHVQVLLMGTVETQRHWSELAVRRTAPVLLGLFSMVTLFAHQYMANKKSAIAVVRRAA